MSKNKENRNYIVYIHTTPSGKKYIGITRNNENRRWGKNGCGYKTQPFMHAIKAYGWDNIKHEILFRNLTEEDAKAWEQALIAMWNTNDNRYGYNYTSGGDSTYTDNKIPVICIETQTVYDSIEDAKKTLNINSVHISSCCKGQRLTSGGFHWEYYDKKKGRKYYKNIEYRKPIKRSKAIICLETLIIYESAVQASKEINCESAHISSCCTGRRNIAHNYHWSYYNSNKPIEYYKKLLREKQEKEKCKYDNPIILIETKQIFKTAKEVQKYLNVDRVEHIINCCEGNAKSAYGFHWAYYDIEKSMSYYDNLDFSPSNNKKVVLVETGQVFNTVEEASVFIGTGHSAISQCLRGKNKTAGGYHWEYI